MGEFSAVKQQNASDYTVTLKGHIDEDATFNNVQLAGANKVVVELDGVTSINSCGIREWIKWVRTAPPGTAIIYRKCPKVIVDQINMVSGFLPETGKVESFYVPYYSEATGNEKMILFSEGVQFKNGEIYPPTDIKDDSGEPMEMDVIEAKYFKFLQK
jgi:hypothetical protein